MQCYIQFSWCIEISPTVPCFGGIIYKYTETAGTIKLLFFRIKEFIELVKKYPQEESRNSPKTKGCSDMK